MSSDNRTRHKIPGAAMRIKICGLTDRDQAVAIAQLGVSTLGFILVPGTPRYVDPEAVAAITAALPKTVTTVGVFLDAPLDRVIAVVQSAGLTAVQLHGCEDPAYCRALGAELPGVERLKAFRVRTTEDLDRVEAYAGAVETVLLDAWHPERAGGSGQVFDWNLTHNFRPSLPWLLAGGLTPHNLAVALAAVRCDGIDLSSGVEVRPGWKDPGKVAEVVRIVQSYTGALHVR